MLVIPDCAMDIKSESTEATAEERAKWERRRQIMGERGVAHHWIINTEQMAITCYAWTDGAWVEAGRVSGQESGATLPPFPDVPLRLDLIFS